MGGVRVTAERLVLDGRSMLLESAVIEKIAPILLADPFGLRNLWCRQGDFRPLMGMNLIVQVLIECFLCAKMLIAIAADIVRRVF